MPTNKRQCMTPNQRYLASVEALAPTTTSAPEPYQPLEVKALRSELAGLRALFERASHRDTAYDLLCNLLDAFASTGCKYRCPITSQSLWRGYLSRDNTLAVKICMGTLARNPRGAIHHKGELPAVFMKRLKTMNSCKEAHSLFV